MSRTQRRLTDDEQRELDGLNTAVADAINARRIWLDMKMHETSSLKVGDDIYDLDTGQKLGTISELYRYWRDRDEGVRDHSHSCDYQYETLGGWFDNTSRQTGRRFGTKDDALARVETRAWLLRGGRGERR